MHKTEPLASSADAGSTQPVARKLRPRPTPTNEPISACPGAGLLVGVAELDEQFEEFLYYAREVLGQSPETIRWYEGAYARYRAFLVDGEVRSGDAFMRRALDLDGWIRWNRERGVRQVTINSYWRAVRRFFVDWQKRFEGPNPFAGLKPPPVRSSVPKALSEEECRRVLEGARHYPWSSRFEQALAVAVIGIMLYAGLRRGEVVALSYDDVDLGDCTIRVERGKGRYGGKDRVAYVAPELRHFLREYLQERRRAGILFPALFASPRYRRPISAAAIKILVQKVRRASGVRFTPHQLRHSFVTHLLRGGTPLHVVADLAGHASLTTTIAYTRVFDEDRRDSLAGFEFSSGSRRRRSTGRYRA